MLCNVCWLYLSCVLPNFLFSFVLFLSFFLCSHSIFTLFEDKMSQWWVGCFIEFFKSHNKSFNGGSIAIFQFHFLIFLYKLPFGDCQRGYLIHRPRLCDCSCELKIVDCSVLVFCILLGSLTDKNPNLSRIGTAFE